MEIQILQYPVFMKIGYFAGERVRGQEVLISLSLNLGLETTEIKDNELSSSLNYAQLIATIESCLFGREIKLIESAVLVLGDELMSSFKKIDSLTVKIEKPVIPDGIAKGANISVSHSFTQSARQ